MSKLLTMVFILIGIGRIVSTYSVFSQSCDEPAHIARGYEWWVEGTYSVGPHHPPLAPIAIGLGPYLAGVRLDDGMLQHSSGNEKPDMKRRNYRYVLGNKILHTDKNYFRNLVLSRVGVLPFFILASILIWMWSRRFLNPVMGVSAVALFTTTPPVLAHSGFATTDMAITATLFGALYSFVLWVGHPTKQNSLWFGFAVGLAVLSKFSAFLFLPLCCFSIGMLRFFAKRRRRVSGLSVVFNWAKPLTIVSLIALLVVFAGYRFSIGPLKERVERPYTAIDRLAGTEGPAHDLVYKMVESPVYPYTELLKGLMILKAHVRYGHPSYCLGEYGCRGWWYFFIVALMAKTPIAFLILTITGYISMFFRRRDFTGWQPFVPPVCALVILVACMPSTINIGIRHILPMFPFLSLIAAAGVFSLWHAEKRKILWRSVVAVLLLWQFMGSLSSHPDYLSYFNSLVDGHREKILINSDLDWGQDLERLSRILREKKVDKLSIAYAGTSNLKLHHLPPFKVLEPYRHECGWIAISLARLKYWPGWEGFSWLEKYEPITMAGKSIKIYYIPETGGTDS